MKLPFYQVTRRDWRYSSRTESHGTSRTAWKSFHRRRQPCNRDARGNFFDVWAFDVRTRAALHHFPRPNITPVHCESAIHLRESNEDDENRPFSRLNDPRGFLTRFQERDFSLALFSLMELRWLNFTFRNTTKGTDKTRCTCTTIFIYMERQTVKKKKKKKKEKDTHACANYCVRCVWWW